MTLGTSTDATTVLYVAGWGRSGTTLIANILGSAPQYVSVGEVRYLWDRGLIQERLCGCGLPVPECSFWQTVLQRVRDLRDPVWMQATRERYLRTRSVSRLERAARTGRLSPEVQTYRDAVVSLTAQVRNVSGAQVVVDSSKSVPDAVLLGTDPRINLRVLHMVRDPRATAYSWSRRKFDPGKGRLMQRHSTLMSSIKWVQWNRAIERALLALYPSTTVRYEDFVLQPDVTLRQIVDDLELPAVPSYLADGESVEIAASHTVSGNPMRFERGPVAIRPDFEWKRRMKQSQKAIATLAAAPLLRRYGYQFRTL